MSSPLSTLKNNKRLPLPGCDSNDEMKAYNKRLYAGGLQECEPALRRDLFSHHQSVSAVTESHSLRSKVVQKRNPKDSRPPSDAELMSCMMQRLTLLEQKVKVQAQDIDCKARRIAVLEKELETLKETARGEKQDQELSRRCRKLKKRVREMESFLNDYGLIWIGNGDDEDDDDDDAEDDLQLGSPGQTWQPEASLVQKFCMDFELVLQNIQQLNIAAGEGESRVTSIPGGATLSQQPCVPLRLFRNGIVMFDGPFRSYLDPTTQQCMQDLMDGYFPSELKDKFPDGLVFEVHDRREEDFVVVPRRTQFPGRGQTIRGSVQCPVEEREEPGDMLPDLSRSQLSGHKLSVEQFLSKLPKVVVKEGKIIDIRSSVKALLLGSANAARSSLVSVIERLDSAGASDAAVACLKVKSEDGEKTFILKMFFSETIGQLRRHLDAHRGSCLPPYDIISLYPHRCYNDDTQTIRACALIPNSTLLLRPRPQQTSPRT